MARKNGPVVVKCLPQLQGCLMIAADHDVFPGRVTHGALEEMQGLRFARLEKDDVDFGVLEAKNFQGHLHFFAVFDATGLLPGKGGAELRNAGALMQGKRRQTGIFVPVVNGTRGLIITIRVAPWSMATSMWSARPTAPST